MEIIVSFTGHRPEKLPGTGIFCNPQTRMIKALIYNEIKSGLRDGCRKFYTGLAMGVDLWAGEILVNLKHRFPEICLIGVSPFPEYANSFDCIWKSIYLFVTKNCDELVYTSPHYNFDSFKIRNHYLVDMSTRLVGVVSDYKSGTGQTISYAKKCQKDIRIIDCNNLEDEYAKIADTIDFSDF
jgi:uncharacterized phage-like protein YoqJ